MYKLELYLIRHGKTICNEKKLYCGKSNISLSENGRRELSELKQKITYPKCEKYFTSGAKRANETFEILYPKERYSEINGFLEYDFGDFEMKSYEMLKEDQEYINWIMDDEGRISCPNGESKKIYRERIKNEFITLVNNCALNKVKSALVVAHGGTIGTILELFHDNSKNFYTWQPECGLGYKLDIFINDEIVVSDVNTI